MESKYHEIVPLFSHSHLNIMPHVLLVTVYGSVSLPHKNKKTKKKLHYHIMK